jgi:AcrR family transcriptional regulator
VAEELIGNDGIAALTMEGIAQAAGLSKPRVYDQFSNVGDVLLALLERCGSVLDEAVRRRLIDADGFEEQVVALVQGYFEVFERYKPGLHGLITNEQSVPVVEDARLRRRAFAESEWSVIYQRKLALPADVSDVAAAMMINSLLGAATFLIKHRSTVDRARCTEACVNYAIGSLRQLSAVYSPNGDGAKALATGPARARRLTDGRVRDL